METKLKWQKNPSLLKLTKYGVVAEINSNHDFEPTSSKHTWATDDDAMLLDNKLKKENTLIQHKDFKINFY